MHDCHIASENRLAQVGWDEVESLAPDFDCAEILARQFNAAYNRWLDRRGKKRVNGFREAMTMECKAAIAKRDAAAKGGAQ
jgi:hypothetical protein